MRSMVEGATPGAEPGIRPLHRVPRSPSPAARGRNKPHPLPGSSPFTGEERAAPPAQGGAETNLVAAQR